MNLQTRFTTAPIGARGFSVNVPLVGLRLALGLLLTQSAGHALATLGQAPAVQGVSMQAGSAPVATNNPLKKLQASSVAGTGLYTAHEVTLATGTVVREFATTDGTVFAVVWRGPVLPDLKSQLGSYAAIFENEAAQARLNGKRGGPIAVNRDGLVMSSGGRMRAFFGHAYLPALVPANLNIQDVLQ
jgi:Protein of unknown function (DUF2844)